MIHDMGYMKAINGIMYTVAEEQHTAKPYCVMAYREGRGFAQQVSKWYCHKGWAIRKWRELTNN